MNKQCPFCGEEILSTAIKCKHCHKWFNDDTTESEKQKMECPFCGEEILSTAKKCKHCSEWLEEITEETNNDFLSSRWSALIPAGIGWALFFFGSWSLVLGEKVSKLDQFLLFLGTGKLQQDFIWDQYAVVFRINEGFWGFAQNDRFFDAPFVQWIMLGISIATFVYAGKILIFGNEE